MKERISLNVRLFLVTMCIAVPVIAALLFTGIRERESARNEKINQLQSDVEIEMSGIDTQLKFLRNSLINLVMDDGDFRHIASAKEKDSEFWLANQRVLEKSTVRQQIWIPGLLCLYIIRKMMFFIII